MKSFKMGSDGHFCSLLWLCCVLVSVSCVGGRLHPLRRPRESHPREGSQRTSSGSGKPFLSRDAQLYSGRDVTGMNEAQKNFRPRNSNSVHEQNRILSDRKTTALDDSLLRSLYTSQGKNYDKYSAYFSGQQVHSKYKNFVAYENRPPVRSSLGELLYYPANFHIVSYLVAKRSCKAVPSIPRHLSIKLDQIIHPQGSGLTTDHGTNELSFRLKTSLISNCSSDVTSKQTIHHHSGSYVFVENPNFNFSYNDPFAYVPDTDPTAYLSLVDLVRQGELPDSDDGGYPDIVPWPKIDLDRMVRTYELQTPTTSGATGVEFLIKALKSEAMESREIQQLLRRLVRDSDSQSSDFGALTEECDAIPSSTDCRNVTKTQKLASCYCRSSKSSKVLCCDFKGHPGTYAVDFHLDETVFMTNARPLTMKYAAGTVRNIFIHNSTLAQVEARGVAQIVTGLHIANCEANNLPPARIVSVSNSKVGIITEPFIMLKKLSLFHSTVLLVQDLKVASEAEEVTPNLQAGSEDQDVGFRAEASKIQYFNNVKFECSAVMYSCTIQRIGSTVSNEMFISGSDIRTVYPSGLTVVRTLSLVNSKIGHLHRGALVAQSGGMVYLKNVAIEHCDESCLPLDRDVSLMLENVVINGHQMEDHKSTEDYRAASPLRHLISASEMNDVCSVKHFQWDCDMFTFAEAPLDFYLRKDIFDYVTIRDHPDIAISEGCFRNITLKNINGSFYHSKSFRSARSGVGCQLQSQLELQNSNLTTLLSRRVGQFSATEGKSTVKYLDLGVVVRFQSTNLNIGVLEHLELRPSNPKVTSFISTGRIGVVQELAINTPITFSGVTFGEVHALIFNHFKKFDTPSLISSSNFGLVHSGGIRVLSGQLMLQNVRFKIFKENMFYLADQTQLLIRGAITDEPLDCFKTGPIISAVSRKQVLYLDGPTPSWLWDCVSFRDDPIVRSLPGPPDARLAHLTIVDPDKDCQKEGSSRISCDFQNIKTLIQLGGNKALDRYKSVAVYNAQNFTIADHCLQEIILVNVKSYFRTKQNNLCFHSLHLVDSRMFVIEANVVELNISLSSVTHVPLPNQVKLLSAKDSQIHDMQATVNSGILQRTRINTMKKLIVKNDVVFEGSYVSEMLSRSIVVLPRASLVLNNTRVGNLQASAIFLFGSLVLDNVVFSRVFNGSILIQKEGTVSIHKLKILHCASAYSQSGYSAGNESADASNKLNIIIQNTEYTYNSTKNQHECDFLQTSDASVNYEFEDVNDLGIEENPTNENVNRGFKTMNMWAVVGLAVVCTAFTTSMIGFIVFEIWRVTKLKPKQTETYAEPSSSFEFSDATHEFISRGEYYEQRGLPVPRDDRHLTSASNDRDVSHEEHGAPNSAEEPDEVDSNQRHWQAAHPDASRPTQLKECSESWQAKYPDNWQQETSFTIENGHEEQAQALWPTPPPPPRVSWSPCDSDDYAADSETSTDAGPLAKRKTFYRNKEFKHLYCVPEGQSSESLSSFDASSSRNMIADGLREEKMYITDDLEEDQVRRTPPDCVVVQRPAESDFANLYGSIIYSDPIEPPNFSPAVDPAVVSVRPKIRSYARLEQYASDPPGNLYGSIIPNTSLDEYTPAPGNLTVRDGPAGSGRPETTEFKMPLRLDSDSSELRTLRYYPRKPLIPNLPIIPESEPEYAQPYEASHGHSFASSASSFLPLSKPPSFHPFHTGGTQNIVSNQNSEKESLSPKREFRLGVKDLNLQSESHTRLLKIPRVRDPSLARWGRFAAGHSSRSPYSRRLETLDAPSSERNASSIMSSISHAASAPLRLLGALRRPYEPMFRLTSTANIPNTPEESGSTLAIYQELQDVNRKN